MTSQAYDNYTAAWICALPLELAAACAMLDERHDPLPLELDSRDTNNYVLGRLGPHNIVIACLPYGVIGTVSAARVVSQMLATFKRIQFGLMIGIGGGVPSEQHGIRLGKWYFGQSEKYRSLKEHIVETQSITYAPARRLLRDGIRTPGLILPRRSTTVFRPTIRRMHPYCATNLYTSCSRVNTYAGLKWPLSLIIDGVCQPHDNAARALRSAKKSMSCTCDLPAFHAFSAARIELFADYLYAISCTGPADEQKLPVPKGFDRRPLAAAVIRLGNSWAHLYRN